MIITTILILALVIFLLSVDASWSNVLSTERNDLVFEGRNQAYGAYAMRTEEPKNMFIALLISVGLVAGGGAWLLATSGQAGVVSSFRQAGAFIDPIPEYQQELRNEKKSTRQTSGGARQTSTARQNTTTVLVTEDPNHQNKPSIAVGFGGDEAGDDDFHKPAEAGDGDGTGTGKGKGSGGEVFVNYPDQMPQFPGGDVALIRYLQEHVRYTEIDREAGLQGTLFFQIVVMTDGRIDHVKLLTGFAGCEGLANRAEKVLRNMPLWTPGLQNGHAVPVVRKIPLQFQLRS
ncbi:MAG: energy transducer TonB [Flavobacteriales bacterium]